MYTYPENPPLEATMIEQKLKDCIEHLGFEDVAEQIIALKALLFAESDPHSEIKQIQDEIASGEYQINDRNIALHMLSEIGAQSAGAIDIEAAT
jgi:hypothetical protein